MKRLYGRNYVPVHFSLWAGHRYNRVNLMEVGPQLGRPRYSWSLSKSASNDMYKPYFSKKKYFRQFYTPLKVLPVSVFAGYLCRGPSARGAHTIFMTSSLARIRICIIFPENWRKIFQWNFQYFKGVRCISHCQPLHHMLTQHARSHHKR